MQQPHKLSLLQRRLFSTTLIGFDDYEAVYWGYNNIYRGSNAIDGQKLVTNYSGPTVMAHKTYWGRPSGPSPNDFYGAVDWSSWLPGSTSPIAGLHKTIENSDVENVPTTPSYGPLDSLRFARLIQRLASTIQRNTDSARTALRLLSTAALMMEEILQASFVRSNHNNNNSEKFSY